MRARRVRIALAAAAVAAAAAGAGLWLARPGRACEDLGPVGSFPPDSVSHVACIPAFVVNMDGITVLLARSGHLEEPLRWDPRRRLFVFDGHGEAYDVRGRYVSGPMAPAPLRRCPTVVRAGRLFVRVPRGTPAGEVARVCR